MRRGCGRREVGTVGTKRDRVGSGSDTANDRAFVSPLPRLVAWRDRALTQNVNPSAALSGAE